MVADTKCDKPAKQHLQTRSAPDQLALRAAAIDRLQQPVPHVIAPAGTDRRAHQGASTGHRSLPSSDAESLVRDHPGSPAADDPCPHSGLQVYIAMQSAADAFVARRASLQGPPASTKDSESRRTPLSATDFCQQPARRSYRPVWAGSALATPDQGRAQQTVVDHIAVLDDLDNGAGRLAGIRRPRTWPGGNSGRISGPGTRSS